MIVIALKICPLYSSAVGVSSAQTAATSSMINKAQYFGGVGSATLYRRCTPGGPVTLSLCKKSAHSFVAHSEGVSAVPIVCHV